MSGTRDALTAGPVFSLVCFWVTCPPLTRHAGRFPHPPSPSYAFAPSPTLPSFSFPSFSSFTFSLPQTLALPSSFSLGLPLLPLASLVLAPSPRPLLVSLSLSPHAAPGRWARPPPPPVPRPGPSHGWTHPRATRLPTFGPPVSLAGPPPDPSLRLPSLPCPCPSAPPRPRADPDAPAAAALAVTAAAAQASTAVHRGARRRPGRPPPALPPRSPPPARDVVHWTRPGLGPPERYVAAPRPEPTGAVVVVVGGGERQPGARRRYQGSPPQGVPEPPARRTRDEDETMDHSRPGTGPEGEARPGAPAPTPAGPCGRCAPPLRRRSKERRSSDAGPARAVDPIHGARTSPREPGLNGSTRERARVRKGRT